MGCKATPDLSVEMCVSITELSASSTPTKLTHSSASRSSNSCSSSSPVSTNLPVFPLLLLLSCSTCTPNPSTSPTSRSYCALSPFNTSSLSSPSSSSASIPLESCVKFLEMVLASEVDGSASWVALVSSKICERVEVDSDESRAAEGAGAMDAVLSCAASCFCSCFDCRMRLLLPGEPVSLVFDQVSVERKSSGDELVGGVGDSLRLRCITPLFRSYRYLV